MAIALTSGVVDTNLASEAFFGVNNPTVFNSVAAFLNNGGSLANVLGGGLVSGTTPSVYLSTTSTQAVVSTTPIAVTGALLSVTWPTSNVELRVTIPSITLSAAGVVATFTVLDNAGTPVTYLLGQTALATATNQPAFFEQVLFIPASAYAAGATVTFQLQAQTPSGTATINKGVLSSQTVSPSFRAVTA